MRRLTVKLGESSVPFDPHVSELYDAEEYVPRVRRVRGKPMFLY